MASQTHSQLVDVSGWAEDEEHSIFPGGAKPKRTVVCPQQAPFPFLIPGHRYLFKPSRSWRLYQHWSELLAHQIAEHVGYSSARYFLAIDSAKGDVGVISEFFYGFPGATLFPRYTSGAHLLRLIIDDFESEPDRHHTMRNIAVICRAFEIRNWREHWASTLAFDALIGNTDRHAENWGILSVRDPRFNLSHQLAPSFDHGTSLGYQIREDDLRRHLSLDVMKRHLTSGKNIIRIGAPKARGHFESCYMFASRYPTTTNAMLRTIDVQSAVVDSLLDELCRFELPVGRLSDARAEFLACLLGERRRAVAAALGE